MTAINLDHHVCSRRRTLLLGRALPILLGEVRPHGIRHTFHLGMVIDTTMMPIHLLKIPLRFSVAMQGPVFALQLGEIRMDIGAKNRGKGGRTLPTTIRMTATVFLETDLMIAEYGMKLGLGIPILLDLLATVRTALLFSINAYRLFLYEGLLHFL